MSTVNAAAPPNLSSPTSPGPLLHRSNSVAIMEGIALLGAAALLDSAGILPTAFWPIHPFMFVVILLSAQYGATGGILSALGAIALSHIGGWPTRPIDMSYVQYFSMAWADSLSWVLAALTVGIVTSHRAKTLAELTGKLHKAMLAESLIAEQYQVLALRTHKLERSLAGRTDRLAPEVTPELSTGRSSWRKPSRSRGPRQDPQSVEGRL